MFSQILRRVIANQNFMEQKPLECNSKISLVGAQMLTLRDPVCTHALIQAQKTYLTSCLGIHMLYISAT